MRNDNRSAAEQSEHLTHLLGAVTNLNDTMLQLHLGMKTRNAQRLVGTIPRQLPTPIGGLVSASPGIIAGIILRDTGGSGATVWLYDGIDPNGPLIWTGQVPDGGYVSHWYLPGGISHTAGLYVGVDGGAVEGVICGLGAATR